MRFGPIEWAWLASSGAAVALIWVRERRRLRALGQIREAVQALGEGRPMRPVQVEVTGPVGRLAGALDAVGPRLEERIAQLERDRQQLNAVLTGISEGVIAIDARRRLVFANAGADRLFGLDAGSVGRLVPELIRSPQIQDAVDATLASPGLHRVEITLVGREAVARALPRVLALSGTPLPGSPAPGAVLVFHDVTELRRLERMRQDFVANVSHELKTPLASIKAYTETLLDWALHDEAVNVRFLRRIEEQAERLNVLIHDLLSLARIESGQSTFDHGPLAIAAAVRARFEALRDRAEAKGLAYILDLDALGESPLVLADEEAIRQILDNLLDNAIKYTPAGGSVRLAGRASAGEVVLDVIDSGIGIPRDDLPRIFERFYRVDKARSREMGGTGLGLSIVKHLAQAIGGRVDVSSRLDEGSTFSVRLAEVGRQEPGG